MRLKLSKFCPRRCRFGMCLCNAAGHCRRGQMSHYFSPLHNLLWFRLHRQQVWNETSTLRLGPKVRYFDSTTAEIFTFTLETEQKSLAWPLGHFKSSVDIKDRRCPASTPLLYCKFALFSFWSSFSDTWQSMHIESSGIVIVFMVRTGMSEDWNRSGE